jgi:histidine ammonia-lyase
VSGRVALVMPRSLATQPERVQSQQDANDRQVCCGQIVERLHYVLACELLAAAQAVDLLGGPGTPRAAWRGSATGHEWPNEAVCEVAGFLDEDRILAPEVERVRNLVESGELLARVASAC